MQDTLKPLVNPITRPEILCLTAEETTTLRHALQATQDLLLIPATRWMQVFWKISLAMTQHFAECPDPVILQHYMACMELLSDFIAKLTPISPHRLDTLLAKLS